MPVPGDTGGDCRRCGEPTVLIGTGHAVLGTWCRACDLVHLIPDQDVYVGEHGPRLWQDDTGGGNG